MLGSSAIKLEGAMLLNVFLHFFDGIGAEYAKPCCGMRTAMR